MTDVITSETTLVEILLSLDVEWRNDNLPNDEAIMQSYYAVAADRIVELEFALRRFREMMDTSEDFPTTCSEIANSIDDLLKRN